MKKIYLTFFTLLVFAGQSLASVDPYQCIVISKSDSIGPTQDCFNKCTNPPVQVSAGYILGYRFLYNPGEKQMTCKWTYYSTRNNHLVGAMVVEPAF